jgi:hypothetical protein
MTIQAHREHEGLPVRLSGGHVGTRSLHRLSKLVITGACPNRGRAGPTTIVNVTAAMPPINADAQRCPDLRSDTFRRTTLHVSFLPCCPFDRRTRCLSLATAWFPLRRLARGLAIGRSRMLRVG